MNVNEMMDCNGSGNINWLVKEDGEDSSDSTSSIGLISEDSMNSCCSSSSELTEDASSSSTSSYLSTSSASSHSNGSLYDLSDLMNHLPIKRGLSMFYQGKAQSFTSLARVQSIEDLPKNLMSARKRMKSCKSYGGGLESHRTLHSPKATISKKASTKGSFASVLSQKRGSFLGGSRPSISVNKNY